MLTRFDEVDARERIIVALDCGRDEAFDIARELSGHATWLKVGMTLYYACGPAIVTELKELGFKVFLDLKLHDIPFQVHGAARSAAATGADMLTMHTLGGEQMLAEGHKGALEARSEGEDACITLGITVLTSMDSKALEQIGIDRAPAEQVRILAEVAKSAGISGVVASAQEASMLRGLLGPDAYIVTPGVRPAGADTQDQSRVATPRQAFANGASHIVIGRPITQAASRASAFEAIVESIG